MDWISSSSSWLGSILDQLACSLKPSTLWPTPATRLCSPWGSASLSATLMLDTRKQQQLSTLLKEKNTHYIYYAVKKKSWQLEPVFLKTYFFFRYGFSNMRYIASLISGVGIFMMGAGLSWYHGIMGLLHPEPIQSLLWVSVCVFALCLSHIMHRWHKWSDVSRFLFCRLIVSWRALWCLKEVS